MPYLKTPFFKKKKKTRKKIVLNAFGPGINGQGPSGAPMAATVTHWKRLAAIGGGFLHKTQ
jgi:hypothetical protein